VEETAKIKDKEAIRKLVVTIQASNGREFGL
jgi:hypothetical protein